MSTELPPSTIPKPPDSADINEMYKWMLDIYTWSTQNLASGHQLTFFTQDQVSKMNNLEQAGKVFFNHTTGKAMLGEVVAGVLSVKTITTS